MGGSVSMARLIRKRTSPLLQCTGVFVVLRRCKLHPITCARLIRVRGLGAQSPSPRENQECRRRAVAESFIACCRMRLSGSDGDGGMGKPGTFRISSFNDNQV